ncbi:MAG: argininosuccinate lyase [Fimbriimonadaceae bacterium]|nr:MAG: argininosuccinate lyase [Fimbriimonadaceae bacterium]
MKLARLWDKGDNIDDLVLRFTVGDDQLLDARLVPYDVLASIAHVRMLGHCGHLSDQEVQDLVEALERTGQEFEEGRWEIALEAEDCHTALEQQITADLGPLGGKVHLGRSRNDQVLTALRLYLKESIGEIESLLESVVVSLEEIRGRQGSIAIPGYTHGQQAMPSSVDLWAGAFAAELKDCGILLDAARQLCDQSPLGSAAGYGTPGLRLDREFSARLMGFSKVQDPVTAAQLSRGKAESAYGFALARILDDLGRLAADLCLFATQEFGFVRLADEISTGSSIMPQKRNPDVFELVRAHASQAQADLFAIMGVASRLPSGYHRDLQLMKQPLFRIIDRAEAVLSVMAHALTKIGFDEERAKEVTTPGLYAAEKAFALVAQENISFREAYRRVAQENSLP